MSEQIIRNGGDREFRSNLNTVKEQHQGGSNGITAEDARYPGARFFSDPGKAENE